MTLSSKGNCLFCKIINHESPGIFVSETKDILVLMDLYPATPGHVLILPRQHIEDIYVMPDEIGAGIMTTAIAVSRAINKQLKPTGLNLVQANGKSAGQTINHFHLHLVPRYENDTVVFKYGHGNTPANTADLERIAAALRAGY